jgi:hypothetical protein
VRAHLLSPKRTHQEQSAKQKNMKQKLGKGSRKEQKAKHNPFKTSTKEQKAK